MEKIVLPLAAASALLFAVGCSNNTSTENQSTNAPEQAPPTMNTTSSSGAETTNAAPSTGAETNSSGTDTNNPAATNNMTPP